MDSLEVAKALASLPLTALLLLVLVGGYMGWWIYGSIHRAQILDMEKRIAELTRRCDQWEMRYLDLKAAHVATVKPTAPPHEVS